MAPEPTTSRWWRWYRLTGLVATVLFKVCYVLLKPFSSRFARRFETFLGYVPPVLARRCGTSPPLWIHAVSTGEMVAAAELVKALADLERKLPPIVVSTTCREAEQLARLKFSSDVADIVYHPLDASGVVRNFLDAINPRLQVIMETDIWPVTVQAAARRRCIVALANGRVSPKTERFYLSRPDFSRRVWDSFAVLMVQSHEEAQRLYRMGVPASKVKIMGNIKFDAALRAGNVEIPGLARELGLDSGFPALVCGSTHREDEAIIAAAWSQVFEARPLRLIIAPRDPDRAAEVASLFRSCNGSVALRSALDSGTLPPQWDVLVVDTIGELASLYHYGNMAFVGGTYGAWGGHSLIEPLSAGRYTLHGPRVRNFQSVAREAAAAGAACEVGAASELAAVLRDLLADKQRLQAAGERASDYARTQAGSGRRQAEVLLSLITETSLRRRR